MEDSLTIPRLRSPIVLVHGLLGFDKLRLFNWTIASYFPGIPELLESGGNRVLMTKVSPTGGVAERAQQLKTYLDQEMPSEPVHLIAHSLGGLDARYLISRLDMAPRVLSLTTLGTPHRGTVFADWSLNRLARLFKPFFEQFDIPRQAFWDLTTGSCQTFNEQATDVPGIRYFSVAGQFNADWLSPEWHLPFRIVNKHEGPNDGMVSVASATWGEQTEIWEGDHFSLINWPHPMAQARGLWKDRGPQYVGLVRRLADEGF
jgi:triacylglycerol lipase